MNQGKISKPLGAGVGGRGRGGLDLPGRQVVAIQDELVVHKSAEKLAAEEEPSSSPIPERVILSAFKLQSLNCYCSLAMDSLYLSVIVSIYKSIVPLIFVLSLLFSLIMYNLYLYLD